MMAHVGNTRRYRKRVAELGPPPAAADVLAAMAWTSDWIKRQGQYLAALEAERLARACMAAAEQAAEERCRALRHISGHAHQPGDPNCCDSCWVSMLDAGLNAIGGKPSIAGVAEA